MNYRARINLLPLNNTLDFLRFVRDVRSLAVLSEFVNLLILKIRIFEDASL